LRLDGIDTLRGFAVTAVVIYHFFVLLGLDNILSPYIHSFGLLGVPLFFIISGYLIYMSIDNNIKKRGAGDGIKNYFIHRVFRILPAYYFNLFIVLLIASFSISNNFLYSQEFKSQLLSHLTLTSYFTHKAVGLGVNGAYWTLNIEMLWYIIAPIFILFIRDIKILTLIAISSLLYLLAVDNAILDNLFHINPQMPSYRTQLFYINSQLMGEINYFIVGVLIYKYRVKSPIESSMLSIILILTLILLFVGANGYFNISESFLSLHLLTITITTGIFILLYHTKLPIVSPINWLGKISYSIYLWHMPILYIMNKTEILLYYSLQKTVVVFIILLLFISSLSYYLIEEGGFRLRERIFNG